MDGTWPLASQSFRSGGAAGGPAADHSEREHEIQAGCGG